MSKGSIKISFRFFITVILLLSIHSNISLSQQDVSEYKARLEKINQEIEDLKRKIKEEEKKQSSILSRLDKIGFEKNLITKEIFLLNIQMNKANSELFEIEKSIPPIKSKLAQEKESITKTIVTLYKFGKLSYLEFLFHVEDVGSLISESKHLALLAQHQEKIISDYKSALAELKVAKEKQEAKKQEIAGFLQNAQKKNQELNVQEKKNRALIREITQNKKIYIQTMEERKERKQQLERLIERLLGRKLSFPFPLIPLDEEKGKISWPVDGKVITSFGKQKHPRFHTTTINNGIVISAKKGKVVKAIHQGIVVYCDHFQGYGNLIIVDHGMTYYSLYGYCSDFRVKKGDVVTAEQPIAIVGDIGSLKGTALYFEIRVKTEPRDPLQWLERR